jgi:hypothetical protein
MYRTHTMHRSRRSVCKFLVINPCEVKLLQDLYVDKLDRK